MTSKRRLFDETKHKSWPASAKASLDPGSCRQPNGALVGGSTLVRVSDPVKIIHVWTRHVGATAFAPNPLASRPYPRVSNAETQPTAP
jgi:hypothetical protein